MDEAELEGDEEEPVTSPSLPRQSPGWRASKEGSHFRPRREGSMVGASEVGIAHYRKVALATEP